MLDKLTGKAIESKIDEYSAVYGEIVLGLHRDLDSLRKDVGQLAADLEAHEKQRSELVDAKAIARIRLIAIAALVIAVAALSLAL